MIRHCYIEIRIITNHKFPEVVHSQKRRTFVTTIAWKRYLTSFILHFNLHLSLESSNVIVLAILFFFS